MSESSLGYQLRRTIPGGFLYLEKIQPVVEKLDEQLKPCLSGQKASELVSQARKNLDAAQAVQEVNVASLSQETLAVYEAKGRLLTQIEKMNKVAGIVFWDRSDIAGGSVLSEKSS